MRRLLNTLYVTNPDALLRKKDDALSVVLDEEQIMSVPFHVLEGVVLFGHVGCSMAVLATCADRGIGVGSRLVWRGRCAVAFCCERNNIAEHPMKKAACI